MLLSLVLRMGIGTSSTMTTGPSAQPTRALPPKSPPSPGIYTTHYAEDVLSCIVYLYLHSFKRNLILLLLYTYLFGICRIWTAIYSHTYNMHDSTTSQCIMGVHMYIPLCLAGCLLDGVAEDRAVVIENRSVICV